MEMIVSIRNNALKRIGGITYFIANNSCYTIRFIFDDIWSAYAVKTAYFIYEDGSAFPVTFEGDVCSVPALLPGVCYIGVSAGEKLSSEPMRVRVCESVHDRIEDEVDEIPASAYDRIMEILNQILHGGTANETDPTVPMWAKSPEKPKYTAEEVGAADKEQLERISKQVGIAGNEVYILGEGETLEDVPDGVKVVYEFPIESSGGSGSNESGESSESGGNETAVAYTPQNKTEDEQMQARANLDIYRKTTEYPLIGDYGYVGWWEWIEGSPEAVTEHVCITAKSGENTYTMRLEEFDDGVLHPATGDYTYIGFLGNSNLLPIGSWLLEDESYNTNMPFVIYKYRDGDTGEITSDIVFDPDVGKSSYQFYDDENPTEVYYPVPEEYIPDSIARKEDIPDQINTALAQAKESGEFDGAPGEDYILTDADKTEIAQQAAALVDTALLGIIGTGEVTA